jgi:hypothetical protein
LLIDALKYALEGNTDENDFLEIQAALSASCLRPLFS